MLKCISPAINLTLFPDGSVRPCCIAAESFGNLNHQSLPEIINSPRAKSFRKALLGDELPPQCRACTQNEKIGQQSLRMDLNERFKNHALKNDSITPDGTITDYSPVYLDLRESNICNLKCRICLHELSSSWYEDTKALDPNYNNSKFLEAKNLTTEELDKLVDNAEEIYFAGGEPLINERHFYILQRLISKKRFDTRIKYNTNFTTLNFKGHYYPELWQKFSNVSIGISIDDIKQRAEYSRKGSKWAVLEKNLKSISAYKEKINFFFFVTISSFNLLGFKDMLDYLIEQEILTFQDVFINILSFPQEQAIAHLPTELKELSEHQLELLISDARYSEKVQTAARQVKNALATEGNNDLFIEFIRKAKALDLIRNEKLEASLPEFSQYV